jgi:hypothetical protein
LSRDSRSIRRSDREQSACQETVLREDILRLLMSDFSAMPVDFASQITVQEMADLLRFLTSR